MKEISVIALVIVLTLSLGACGRKKQEPTQTTRDTAPMTVPTMPDMTTPTSNIPDPTVDSNSTMSTDGTGDTAATNTNPSTTNE